MFYMVKIDRKQICSQKHLCGRSSRSHIQHCCTANYNFKTKSVKTCYTVYKTNPVLFYFQRCFQSCGKKKISFRFQTLYQKFVPAVNVCVKRRTIDTLSVFTADTMAIEAFLQWIDVMVKFNVQEIVPLLQTHDSFSSTFELVATTKIKKWRAGGAKQ